MFICVAAIDRDGFTVVHMWTHCSRDNAAQTIRMVRSWIARGGLWKGRSIVITKA